MSFFDTPIEFCPIAERYVLLDQTCAQCRKENGCLNRSCPLEPWFSRYPFRQPHAPPVRPAAERGRASGAGHGDPDEP